MKALATLIIALLATSPVVAGEHEGQLPPTIAIIIDDMGHNLVEGERLIALDQPITLAFLPYRRYTTRLAELAHQKHKEIMLHAPMANTRNIGLGPGDRKSVV